MSCSDFMSGAVNCCDTTDIGSGKYDGSGEWGGKDYKMCNQNPGGGYINQRAISSNYVLYVVAGLILCGLIVVIQK